MSYTSFALACLASAAQAGVGSSHGYQTGLINPGLNKLGQDPTFIEYMSVNNKGYNTVGQFEQRQINFHENESIIGANNRSVDHSDPDALILGLNRFSDWSNAEYRDFLTYMSSGTSTTLGASSNRNGRGLQDTATTIDHAADGFMVAVKDQGSCGSCWAFAGNTTAEGTLAKKTNTSPVHLSEQHMVDCTIYTTDFRGKNYGAYGCQGAWMTNTWDFQKDHGAMLESDYVYQSGSSGTEYECRHDDSKTQGGVQSWGQITGSIDDFKAKVRQQPVSVALDAGSSAFQSYRSGVIKAENNCGNQLNHAVVVVGYSDGNSPDDNDDNDDDNTPDDNDDDNTPDDNDDNDNITGCKVTKWWHSCPESRRLQDASGHTDYWKVQNSWGVGYGDAGFVRVQITDGEGVCGINREVYWADWGSDKY